MQDTKENATIETSKENIKDLGKAINEGVSYDNAKFLYPSDAKNLKKNRYDKIADNCDTSYVIQNQKTKQIVELKAHSAFHAANLIGWRLRHTSLMETIKHSDE